jgi:beta-lactamase superfamily II metal-dependent hydrolase
MQLSATVRSTGSSWLTTPSLDEIEVAVFGPGFGECIIIHVGDDRWVVVDSCQPATSAEPIAIEYLRSLGRDPARCVALIVATHWHDDHIRGLDALFKACPGALFCCSSATGTEEFEAMVMAFDRQRMITGGSGMRTLNGVFNTLQDRPERPPRLASAAKCLLHIEAGRAGHPHAVRVTALSPSDHEHAIALARIAQLMPTGAQTQYRCPTEDPNLTSVALHIEIGGVSILLGADLEHHSDGRRGWTAVLEDTTLPTSRAIMLKVPHHGSQGADSPDLWTQRLVDNPFAVTTPWSRGGAHLPTAADIARLVGQRGLVQTSSSPSATGRLG